MRRGLRPDDLGICRILGLAPFDHFPDVGNECLPAWIGPVAVPTGEVGRLGQFEHDRPLAWRDHRGDQGAVPVADRGFGTDPTRLNRGCRP